MSVKMSGRYRDKRTDHTGTVVAAWMPCEDHPAGYVTLKMWGSGTLTYGWNEFQERFVLAEG
jgi:hypothetical protein